jgi:RNA polymerase sigma-70 factor (ECF subfamily)
MHDFHSTEDIFEEVVLLAMKHADQIEDNDHLLAWARRTARCRGIDHLRRQSLRPFLLADDVLDQLEDCWSESDGVPDRDRIDALRDCIARLTEKSQKVIAMRYAQGMSGKAVAEATNQNVHSVYVALTRIYRSLGECIRRKLERAG